MRGIEQDLIREVQPQLDALKSRVDNPENWLQDFECEINFRLSAGKDDTEYDKEESENVIIIRRQHCSESVKESLRTDKGINWNEFEDWEGHHDA